MEYNQMLREIQAHIDKSGKPYSQWYAGITSNLKERLYEGHGVPEKNAWYVSRRADSSNAARHAEAALLKLGCDGGSGGGDQSAQVVYAYLKTPATDP